MLWTNSSTVQLLYEAAAYEDHVAVYQPQPHTLLVSLCPVGKLMFDPNSTAEDATTSCAFYIVYRPIIAACLKSDLVFFSFFLNVSSELDWKHFL